MLHKEPTNKFEAQAICQKYDGYLPEADPSDTELYKILNEFMKLNYVDKCWLGIQEQIHSTPHWINSSPLGMAYLNVKYTCHC